MPFFERPVLIEDVDYCWDDQTLVAISTLAFLALNTALKNQAYPFILGMASCDKLQMEAEKITEVDFISDDFDKHPAIETLQMFVTPVRIAE